MVQRATLWGSVVLIAALLGVSAPWSRVLPPCKDVPAAERERMRLAGRCEGRAPIVEARPGARGAPRLVTRPVPDLRGRPFNLRDERLGRFLVAVDYRPSAQRRDWVIDQVPRPPASLPDGGDLRVVLSDGALVRVPDVRGSFARALAVLYRAGLGWSTGDASPGSVVGQVPAPGAAVKPGTPITLRFAGTGPVALAPESTKPDVAPAPPPATVPPVTTPPATAPSAPPPVNATPAPTAPRSAAPAPAAPPMTMPDLQGLSFDAARDRLAGFSVDRVHRAGTETGGTVIGQSPAAGTRLAPGTAVRLVLSDGSLVRVPRVRSFMLDEARQRLVPGELRPVITNVPSDAPAGTVISQQPAENQIAQRGGTVRLTVSSGPAARRPVSVPNLVGSTLERARAQLGRLKVERSERGAREPVGTILEQTPAPGTAVEPGSTVSIVVSSGGRPEVIDMTNVVGQSVEAATGALSEFRLEREAVPSTEPAGRVLSQDPPPGAPVPPGSTVRLRVSDGSRVLAPSLAQMSVAQAREAARAAGLALAPDDAARDDSARVTGQEPAPGTEVGRGSALRLTVEERALPVEVPPAVRDAWTQASAFLQQQPPRNLAIAAVVLLALIALLLLARRRARGAYVVVEPVFASTRPRAERPPPAASPPAAATPAKTRVPPPVVAPPAAAPATPRVPATVPASVMAPPAATTPSMPRAPAPDSAAAVTPRAAGPSAAPKAPAPVTASETAPPATPTPTPPRASPPDTTPAVTPPAAETAASPRAPAPVAASVMAPPATPPSTAPRAPAPDPAPAATPPAAEAPASMRPPAPVTAPPAAATSTPPRAPRPDTTPAMTSTAAETPASPRAPAPVTAPVMAPLGAPTSATPRVPTPVATPTTAETPAAPRAPAPVTEPVMAPPTVPTSTALRAPAPVPASAGAAIPAILKRRGPAAPPVVAARPREPEPVVYGAVARFEVDPAKTIARNAAPRGPEIRVGARLEPGDGSVRELPAETAPDELTEETK